MHMLTHPEKSTVPMLQREEGIERPGIWKADCFDSVSLILDPSRKASFRLGFQRHVVDNWRNETWGSQMQGQLDQENLSPQSTSIFSDKVYWKNRGNNLSWLRYNANSITDRIKSLSISFLIHSCHFYEHSIRHFLKLKPLETRKPVKTHKTVFFFSLGISCKPPLGAI